MDERHVTTGVQQCTRYPEGHFDKGASGGNDIEAAGSFKSDRHRAMNAQVLGQQFRREMTCQRLKLGQGRGLQHQARDIGLAAPDLSLRVPDRLDVE